MNNKEQNNELIKDDDGKENRDLLRDELDREIMNSCQGGFPVTSRPFQKWSENLDISEEELIKRLKRLKKEGAISRFGPVLNPRAMGGESTLAAMSVPETRFNEVAKLLNKKPQISHNYRRNHELNMWFVVSAESEEELEETLKEIRNELDLKIYNMPMLEEYYIGVKFNF